MGDDRQDGERERVQETYERYGRSERKRVQETYERYGRSERKRRSWAAENPGNVAIRDELTTAAHTIAGASISSAARILDAACGSGWWLQRLADDSSVRAELHGIDLLPDRVAAAGERVPSAELVVGDIRRLPYGDGSFEVITLFTALSSLASEDDVVRALDEAARVLASDGVLMIWEPRIPSPLNRATLLIGTRLLTRALPSFAFETRTTTVLPPLARRLGARTEQLYPRLASVPALRSHRLYCARPTQTLS